MLFRRDNNSLVSYERTIVEGQQARIKLTGGVIQDHFLLIFEGAPDSKKKRSY